MNDINNKLEELVNKEVQKKHTHSILLGVQSGDKKLNFTTAAGEAKIESPYYVASIAKIFTATVIMQLVDEGKIHLDNKINQYLQNLSLDGIHVFKGIDYSNDLTVRHLLHQTSGLSDYFNDGLAEDFKKNKDHYYTIKDVIDMARNSKPFAKPDSGKSYYSDTNFQLLSEIIETVTQKSLGEVFKDRIFEPLEMDSSYLYDYRKAQRSILPLSPYFKDTKLSIPMAITSERGTGGVVSNMSDLLKFLPAFFGGDLFNKIHFKQMMMWNPMFFPMQYGLGIWRFKLPNWMNLFRETPEFIGHSGVWGAMAFYNPKHDIYIVGTLNQLDKQSRQFSLMTKVLQIVI